MNRVALNALFVRPGIVGGTETSTVGLLRGLADTPAADIELVVLASRAFADVHADIASRHRVVSPLGRDAAPPARIVLEHTWLAREVSRLGADLVHHLGGTLPAFGSRPAVLTVHDIAPLLDPERFGAVKRAYLRAALPRSIRASTRVAAVSEFTRDQLVRVAGVDRDRIDVVRWGVDPAPATPGASAPPPLPPGLPDGAPFVLYPTITYGFKRHVFLIEVFAELAETDERVHLVLTGGAADAEDDVRAAIAASPARGRIHRTGRVSDEQLEGLYAAATVVAVPSSYEGFGLPALEAMARGCPVVSSDQAALPEVVNGAGVVVGVDDRAGWVRELRRVLRDADHRDALIVAGRAEADRRTWTATAHAQLDCYRRALRDAP